MPSSRAISAIGRPLVRTSSTASRLNSGVNCRLFLCCLSGIWTPSSHRRCPATGGKSSGDNGCGSGTGKLPETASVSGWFASEFAIENRLWIRQHPLGLLTRGGGSDYDRTRAWHRPARPACQAVPDPAAEVRDLAAACPWRDHDQRGRRPLGGGPLHDHAAAHGRQGRGAPGAGRLQARRAPGQAGPGAGGGQGGGGTAGRGAQGAGRPAAAGGGKRALGLSGRVPPRVDQATKAGLLALLDHAVDQGWTVRAACAALELGERRAWRWLDRRAADQLADLRPGGGAVHGLLDWEVAEIVELFHQWGQLDRSHRKLAHRGSYLGRVWASPSSVRRVLAAEGLRLRPLPRPGRSVRQPFPDWVEYQPGTLWIFDTTHFTRAGVAVTAIEDLVDQVAARLDGTIDLAVDDPVRPILLALSDIHPEWRADRACGVRPAA